MAFMRLLTMVDEWYEVEGRDGCDFIPASVCGALPLEVGETVDDDDPRWKECVKAVKGYCDCGRPEEITAIGTKWAARYVRLGEMGATDWCLGDTKAEVVAECKEVYGDEEEKEETDEAW
jgi:hypothetical protein